MWLLSLELDNQGLDLSRQLVGIAYRAFGAVTQRLKPVLLVTVKDLVAGLARNAELPAHIRHRLPIQETSDKAQTLFHHRTRFPRHRHLPRNKSGKCNPCVRYVLSPMSRAAHVSVQWFMCFRFPECPSGFLLYQSCTNNSVVLLDPCILACRAHLWVTGLVQGA